MWASARVSARRRYRGAAAGGQAQAGHHRPSRGQQPGPHRRHRHNCQHPGVKQAISRATPSAR